MAWFDDLILKYRTVFGAGIATPSRKSTNFTGAGVAVTDDAVNDRTIVTIPGATTPASVVVAALSVDWSLSGVFTKTLSAGSNTFTFANATDGQTIVVVVTGAASTVTWPTVKWAAGASPTQTASGTDAYTFVKAGTTIYGSVVQAMS